MSDTSALGDEGLQTDLDPDAGVVEPGSEQPEGEQPSRQYVEVDDPDNRFVRVKVNGEEVEVPFSEAVRGYSREADYTRKTQELASQRDQIEAAMRFQRAWQADPEGTLQILQRQIQGQQPQQSQPQKPQFDDPLEERIWELDQRLAQMTQAQQEREINSQLDQTINGLRQQYGASEDDIVATVIQAQQMNLPIGALPQLYKAMAFDRIQAQLQAHRQTEAERQADEARRTAAKTAASGVVTAGTGTSTGALTSAPPNRPMTIREAAEAAFEQHGMPELFS